MQLEALRHALNWLRCSPMWNGIRVSQAQGVGGAGQAYSRALGWGRWTTGQTGRLLAPGDRQT